MRVYATPSNLWSPPTCPDHSVPSSSLLVLSVGIIFPLAAFQWLTSCATGCCQEACMHMHGRVWLEEYPARRSISREDARTWEKRR